MPVTDADRSTGLTMSYTQRAAAATATSASISTPVRATVPTSASTRMIPRRGRDTSTRTEKSGTGWQRGRIPGVAFAAMIPATRETASTSPFGIFPSLTMFHACADRCTYPSASATRTVSGFPETSAIPAVPRDFTGHSPFPAENRTWYPVDVSVQTFPAEGECPSAFSSSSCNSPPSL